jgi:hypothetical protein
MPNRKKDMSMIDPFVSYKEKKFYTLVPGSHLVDFCVDVNRFKVSCRKLDSLLKNQKVSIQKKKDLV